MLCLSLLPWHSLVSEGQQGEHRIVPATDQSAFCLPSTLLRFYRHYLDFNAQAKGDIMIISIIDDETEIQG